MPLLPIAGKKVDVCDADCEFKTCLWVREDPGVFTQGQGYRAREGPRRLLCGTREAHGCPDHGRVDIEKVRCCRAPDLPKTRHRVFTQTCRRCRTRLTGRRLELARDVEAKPATRCDHKDTTSTFGYVTRGAHPIEVFSGDAPAWRCSRCHELWEHAPEPFEPGEESKAFHDRRLAAWRERMRQLGVVEPATPNESPERSTSAAEAAQQSGPAVDAGLSVP